MKKIGIFYGTTSGRTGSIVEEIEFCLKKTEYSVFNVKDGVKGILDFENLIFVTPTYGVGELQSDWNKHLEELKMIDFSGKTVALVGLGDQFLFGESFVGALKVLYDIIIAAGGKVIGFTDITGYHFKECDAIVDNQFVGLALDEHRQDDLTPDRIFFWVKSILPLFS